MEEIQLNEFIIDAEFIRIPKKEGAMLAFPNGGYLFKGKIKAITFEEEEAGGMPEKDFLDLPGSGHGPGGHGSGFGGQKGRRSKKRSKNQKKSSDGCEMHHSVVYQKFQEVPPSGR